MLDCGAGTGFLSLMAARLGHRVTALDLSEQMLERLRQAADGPSLEVTVVVGPADVAAPTASTRSSSATCSGRSPTPPARSRPGGRPHPQGRLVLFESLWGDADPLRAGARRRHRKALAGGCAASPPTTTPTTRPSCAPRSRSAPGTPPARLCELAVAAGWAEPRLERLRDIEWAERTALPLPERLVGVTPRVAVIAD